MKEYQNYIFDLYGTLVDIHTNEKNYIYGRNCLIFMQPLELFIVRKA
jgi:FMN phosphatase YigB (HAD superfamily)